jgi:hypothetical protein
MQTTLVSFRLVSYIVIPIGVMLISWGEQRNFNMRLNAGVDLFAFGFALDLSLLLQEAVVKEQSTASVQAINASIIVLALLISLVFLQIAARTQSEILQSQLRRAVARRVYYPLGKVWFCWVFAISVIVFHLYLLLGR